MERRIVGALLTSLAWMAACPLALGAEEPLLEHERPNRFPELPLYPSKPVPGYPGFRKPYIKMPPERIPYPGSVEHTRHYFMKYLPALPFYSQKSLVANWRAKDLLAGEPARLTTFAEKIYRYRWPNDREWETRSDRSETAELADRVPVVRLRPGESLGPLAFGPLRRGLHVLRLIAAVRPEDDVFPPPEMLFELAVNDGPEGGKSVYLLRGRTMCNFYAAVEFFFHATDGRRFAATLTYLKASEPDLFVHNAELHDVLAEMRFPGIKRKQTLPVNRQVNDILADVLAGEAKAGHRFDPDHADALWRSVPPLNTMLAAKGITWAPAEPKKASHENRVNLKPRMWVYAPAKDGAFRLTRSKTAAKLDDVEAPAEAKADPLKLHTPAKGRGADELRLDEGPALDIEYTWADLAARRPLPGTHDFGCGERVRGPGRRSRYNADLPVAASRAYAAAAPTAASLAQMARGGRLTANTTFATAFRFAALVYQLPSLTFTHHLPHQVNIWRPDRMPGHIGTTVGIDPVAWSEAYDVLFPYIGRSRKLAAALGRCIPGIETPDDVVRLFDACLVQYAARLYRTYRLYWSHNTAEACIRLATIMNNAEASRPLIGWLSRHAWVYPQALGGFMDNFAIGCTRDGGSTIGSFLYGHAVHMGFVEMMDRYVAASGDRTFDLSDWTRFPKARAALLFPLRGLVAGYYHPGIGDVADSSRPFYSYRASVLRAARLLHERTGRPEFAHLIVKHGARTTETEAEWERLKAAAATARDPVLAERSRVQADWQAVLESGAEHDDPRAKAAVSIRIGTGAGHAHSDTLDLRVWAHGLCLIGDAGMRPDYGLPTHGLTRIHNLVEVDEHSHHTHAWARTLADLPGAHYLETRAAYPDPAVRLYARQTRLVRAAEGTIPPGPAVKARDASVHTPEHYVVDVLRVAGGRVHTWCFHGAVDDGFEVNVPKRLVPTDALRKYLDGFYYDAKYYQLLHDAYVGGGKPKKDIEGFMKKPEDEEVALEEERAQPKMPALHEPWVGRCEGDELVATWRLEPVTAKRMIEQAAAPTPERKFTRITLLDARDATVLHGICLNDPYRNTPNPTVPYYAKRKLYARREAEGGGLESVFVALIEPYSGEPEVAGRRLLAIEGNEADARRAVAVEVATRGGRTDLCFADGRPERERAIEGGIRIAAEAAFLSRDAQGLRQASITSGRRLRAPDIELEPATAAYEAKIRSVDFAKLRVGLDRPLPHRVLYGLYLQLGNDAHTTGYTVATVEAAEGASTLVLDTSIEIFRSRVMFLYDDVVRVATSRLLPHGKRSGLTATNESYSKVWKAEALPGGNRWNGFGYRLSGPPLRKDDFPPGSGLVIHELGPDDRVRMATFVGLRRREAGVFAVTANVRFTVRLKGGGAAEASADGQAWSALPAKREGAWLTIQADPERLGSRDFMLRLR